MLAAELSVFWGMSTALALGAVATGLAARAYYRREPSEGHITAIDSIQIRAALDQVDIAIALIDADFRARFINQAYRRIFRITDAMANDCPSLTALLEHKYNQRVYEIASAKETYVSERLALIRSGDENPIDLRLANGDVMRFRCKALADGGWMLNYGNVSDLVRTADELAELAKTDSLTGVYNRRFFFAKLEDEWARYHRHHRPLSVLVIDLDNFKAVNDSFGHEAGDNVISRVAHLCLTAKRESDTFARLGGEEFGLLLPDATLEDARSLAERVRAAIAAEHWPAISGMARATASIGVAEALAAMNSPADLLRDADKALYRAKRAGRNRVVAITYENDQARSAAA
jgi:diguanylate cyclase (GGDEF)-like protein